MCAYTLSPRRRPSTPTHLSRNTAQSRCHRLETLLQTPSGRELDAVAAMGALKRGSGSDGQEGGGVEVAGLGRGVCV